MSSSCIIARAAIFTALCGAGIIACSSDRSVEPQGTDLPALPTLPFSGALVAHGKTIHELGRGLARALESSEVRSWVRDELQRSPYVEHRIRLREALLQASRARILGQIAAGAERRLGPMEIAAVDELELYFPIQEHFAAWQGEKPVQVAVPLNRDGDYVIYTTAGQSSRVRGDVAPSIPTLVLGPSEIDYADLQSAVRGGSYTGDMMMAPHFTNAPIRPSFGISTLQHTRITYFRTNANHDDFFAGSDEVEMFGGLNGPGWDPATPYKNCKRFTNISKNINYVFPNDAARTIANAVPTGSPDKVRVDAWEDDNDPCVLHTGDDDFYGFISLAIEQYGSIWATIRDSGAPGHISVRVEAGTP